MGFHEVRFPTSVSFGAIGGPQRRTEIVTLSNGFEERNAPWAHSRRRYDAGVGMRSLSDLETVIAFFEARQGQLFGFRWKDWSDYRSCPADVALTSADQTLGTGDGARTTFQLVKEYASGGARYQRPIRKPVAGSVRVRLDDRELVSGTEFTVSLETGEVALATPPALGQTVRAGFEFDVPARFDTDRLDVSIAAINGGEVPSIPVVEIRI